MNELENMLSEISQMQKGKYRMTHVKYPEQSDSQIQKAEEWLWLPWAMGSGECRISGQGDDGQALRRRVRTTAPL